MSTYLRIAHFAVGRCNPDSANGIDRAVSGLGRAEARLGHTVAIFSLTNKEPLPIAGVDVHCWARGADGRGSSAVGVPGIQRFSLPPGLVEDLLAWRPDVVHLHSVHVPENIALGRRLRRAGIPYAISAHGGLSAVIRKRHRWIKLALKLVAERSHLRSAAFLRAISSQDAAGIRGYGVDGKVAVVPNGIELEGIPSLPGARRLRELFPALGPGRVYVFLGRLDPTVKGLDLLFHAVAQMAKPPGALVLVGPGRDAHTRALLRLSSRLGLGPRVVFAGPAHGQLKFDLLAGADVFVHPSRTEGGVPFSVLEAAAMSKPCLVTAATDPSRMLERYGAGIVVRADSRCIAEAIGQFEGMNAGELARMGGNARRMVEREFDWEPIATRIVDCYRTFAVAPHG